MLRILFLVLAASQFSYLAPTLFTQSGGGAPATITLSAKKYEFTPSTINATKGQRVRIEATATDRTHGFEIKDFNVKVKLEKEKMTVIEFVPDKTGEFEIKCSEFCGLGHGKMKGKLIVSEAK
jgi:cytochrome c oxidase subunit 2